MKKVRVTVHHNQDDPADDLRYAGRVRQSLWAHSPVEIDFDNPTQGMHRDASRNAYFEFATDYPQEVERVIHDYGFKDRVDVEIDNTEAGTECVNCGNVAARTQPTVCPSCGFRDIAACPFCQTEIGRQSYEPQGGDVFQCPSCHHRVRLRFREPMFDDQGFFLAPLVLVDRAEE